MRSGQPYSTDQARSQPWLQAFNTYLQGLGIDFWVPKDKVHQLIPLLDRSGSETEAESAPLPPQRDRSGACNTQQELAQSQVSTQTAVAPQVAAVPQMAAAPQIAVSAQKEVSAQKSEVADAVSLASATTQDQGELKYSFLIQPLSTQLVLFCELEDADAPSLSVRETTLLNNILQAITSRLSGQPIPLSDNLFRWPVSTPLQGGGIFSDRLFALKAFEGLLHGQLNQGVTHLIVLGDQIDCREFNLTEGSLQQFTSLAKMAAGDKASKGALWQRLQEVWC